MVIRILIINASITFTCGFNIMVLFIDAFIKNFNIAKRFSVIKRKINFTAIGEKKKTQTINNNGLFFDDRWTICFKRIKIITNADYLLKFY